MTSWNPTADDPPSADIQELADLWSPSTVIDIGCGTGRNLIPFDRPGCNLYGIDNDMDAVRATRARFETYRAQSVTVTLADVRDYKPQRVFDVLLCHGVLHFLTREERLAVYEGFKLWTAAGGLMSLVMFNAAVPIPADLRPLMREPAADSGEMLTAFSDRCILRHRTYVYEDTHDEGTIHHRHAIDRLLVQNSSGSGDS